MTTATLLATAGRLLAPWAQSTATPDPTRLDVIVQPAGLQAAVAALHNAKWGYLAAITGMDLGAAAGQFEVLYHFCADAAVLTLRLRTPRDEASVPTIALIIPPASLYERELMEMFGVDVVGTPNRERLFTPENLADDQYPLRKDFAITEAAT